MTRAVYSIRWDRKAQGWNVVRSGKIISGPHDLKRVAIAEGKRLAKAARLGQLRICGKSGRIQTEHTYPRSSDPVRYVG